MFRYRKAHFNFGSRTDSRDTFFCSAKRKYPKKRRPGCRLTLRSKAFDRGCRKGHPWPSGNARHPCRAPSGLILSKASVLGAAYGRKPHHLPAAHPPLTPHALTPAWCASGCRSAPTCAVTGLTELNDLGLGENRGCRNGCPASGCAGRRNGSACRRRSTSHRATPAGSLYPALPDR